MLLRTDMDALPIVEQTGLPYASKVPAEEVVQGAKAMLGDGLCERFGKPDFALALHVSPKELAGTVGCCPGFSAAASDSAHIVVRGKGGVPTFMFRLGTATPEKLEADGGACALHTPQYSPEVRNAKLEQRGLPQGNSRRVTDA